MVLLLLLVPASLRAQDAPPWNPDGNGDGCITTSDLVLLLSVFGLCPEPTPFDCPDSDVFSFHDTLYFNNYGHPTVLIGEQRRFMKYLRTTAQQNRNALQASSLSSVARTEAFQ